MKQTILSYFRSLFLEPFLMATTLIPVALVFEFLGGSNLYKSFWDTIATYIFQTNIAELSISQMVITFVVVVFVISSSLKFIFRKLGLRTKITYLHVIVFMTLVYFVAYSIMFFKEADRSYYIFVLPFYLFNVFSIFAWHIVERAKTENIWTSKL